MKNNLKYWPFYNKNFITILELTSKGINVNSDVDNYIERNIIDDNCNNFSEIFCVERLDSIKMIEISHYKESLKGEVLLDNKKRYTKINQFLLKNRQKDEK